MGTTRRSKWIVGLLVIFVGILVGVALWKAPPPKGPPQAVVLLTIDTLRADHVSFNGYASPTTPFLDSLAAKGVVFSNTYAPASSTPPSMASLFAGAYPVSHGVDQRDISKPRGRQQPALGEEYTTIAEYMKEMGYITIGIPSNTHLRHSFGFAQGFDYYDLRVNFPYANEVNDYMRSAARETFGDGWRNAWRKQKTFFWIHYVDPHSPYDAYEPWISQYAPELLNHFPENPAGLKVPELVKSFLPLTEDGKRRIGQLYDSEIFRTDQAVREFWSDFGFDDNVLLIVTSDHGEEIGEHGSLGHSRTIHEEVVHVPMMVHWPTHLPSGIKVATPAMLMDVLPTFLELLGRAPAKDVSGVSLVPFLQGAPVPADPASRPIICEARPASSERYTSLYQPPWKVIRIAGDTKESWLLYDLQKDRLEAHDLSVTEPEVLKTMQEKLQREYTGLPGNVRLNRVPILDEKEVERLRALGYIAD